jgi:hypothetical protein
VLIQPSQNIHDLNDSSRWCQPYVGENDGCGEFKLKDSPQTISEAQEYVAWERGLPGRIRNCLARMEVFCWEDLSRLNIDTCFAQRNFGIQSCIDLCNLARLAGRPLERIEKEIIRAWPKFKDELIDVKSPTPATEAAPNGPT